MELYSYRKQEFTFKATTLGSVVPSLENQNYILGSSPLAIKYEPFKVLPYGYNAGNNETEAYIFVGDEIPKYIDFNCACLTKVGS